MSNALSRVKSIAILRHISAEEIIAVAEMLAEAGIDCIEVTLNTENALSMIETLASRDLGGAIVGAGTVTRPEQALQIASAGGKIAISPNTNVEVIRAVKASGLSALPGCLTPTEAFAALAAGADGLKVFPCEMAPPSVIRALKAVLPPLLPLFVVGGIGAQNIAEYLEAGAHGVGVGTWLYKPGKSLASSARDAADLMRILDRHESE